MDRYSDTIFLIRQITKQHYIFNHSKNYINDHPNMANNTKSRQKMGIFSAILNCFFSQTKSQGVTTNYKECHNPNNHNAKPKFTTIIHRN